jgi:hypothetical protein
VTGIHRAILLLSLCGLAWAQGGKNKSVPKAPAAPAAKVPKQAAKSDTQVPRSIPGKQIEQLQKMTPEEREKALANLTPERREQVEKQLNRLDQLSPEARQELDRRFEKLQSFPPARQRAVRQEVQSLRGMSFSDRQARLHSDEFKQQFAPEEQDLIRGVFPGAAR